eukprot:TRINITY_DN15975_c0_g1_i2.p1 TRINITY_DN15975_c0_g1~~TRINITY_DN15975_c0_g1_i2.p1  ORF type:complete len:114 (-),score=7.57 TRINITY_DN15975_c0_g1_i2:252-542(-)
MMVGKINVALVVALLLSCADSWSTNNTNCVPTATGEGKCENDVLSLFQKSRRQQGVNYIAEMFPPGIAKTSKLTRLKYKELFKLFMTSTSRLTPVF